ncbi:hypothetical protein F5Y05DRAFT_376384 [Hypoxylon sp. FL0543]|nr:hypothetical protein F5Y05DRAFT_376384 [Hypoxylon sp. FL0543]
MAATFTLFMSLAPELRHIIWSMALPIGGPTLYFYKKGYWQPRQLTESDEGYLPGHDNMELRFHLENAEFDLPTFSVNREACRITLAWMREQGIEIRSRADGQLLFVRPFNSQRDIVYVPDDRWGEFCREGNDRMAESDMLNRSATIESEVWRLAVSELLPTEDQFTWLPEAIGWYDQLKEVLVIVGEQPTEDEEPRMCQLEGEQGPALVWHTYEEGEEGYDHEESKGEYVREAGESEFNIDGLEGLINLDLRDEFCNMGMPAPKIRPVCIA